MFERYRRILAATKLPPALEARFHLQTAESYEALSQPDGALDAAGRARDVAERYQFNEMLFAAEAVVTRVAQGQGSVPQAPEIPVPASLRAIAATIRDLRSKVPAGGR